jgi:hypothetical protein
VTNQNTPELSPSVARPGFEPGTSGLRRFFEKMKALICNALCFDETENDRFGPNSGGVSLTQSDYGIIV